MFLVACQNDVNEIESAEKKETIEVESKETNDKQSILKNEILEDEVEKDVKISKRNNTSSQPEAFDFLSIIQVVEVKEFNNAAVKEEIKGGLSTTKAAYDSKAKRLFIYGDIRNPEFKESSNISDESEVVLKENKTPKWTINEDTSMIVMEDVSSLGKLISNKLHSTKNPSFKSKLSSVKKEMVRNENRLFLNSSYEIKKLKDGIVELTFEGKKHLINPGESFETEKKKNGIISTLEISNHGMLDSSVNIMFEDPTNKVFVDESKLTGKGLYDEMNKAEIRKLTRE